MEQFWIVVRDFDARHVRNYSGSSDAGKFNSIDAALAEAEAKAKNNPGKRYIVLTAYSAFETEPPPPPVVKASLYGGPSTVDEDAVANAVRL